MATTHWRLSLESSAALVLGSWTYTVAASGDDWGPWGMHMMWGSWGIGMMLMMFLLWAAIIAGIVVGIRWLVTASKPGPQQPSGRVPESALDILKRRYARGEISKPEFDEMRRDLQEGV